MSYLRTAAIRQKIRKGVLRTLQERPELRQRMSEAARGHKRWLGREHRPESIEKMRNSKRGRPSYERSAETKRKTSTALKRLWADPRYRERMCRIARNRSPQTREKQRQNRLRQRFPTKMTDIERTLCEEFRKRRLRFEMNKTIFGHFQPDFVFEDVRLIVQADGDYWHRRSNKRGSGGAIKRDHDFAEAAAREGWTVWRFAESEIALHPAACGRAVARFVRSH